VTPLALLWQAAMIAKLRFPRRKKALNLRRVLLVSWDFPPSNSTGVHVPASFARYASLEGWFVSVVCGPAPDPSSAAGQELAASISDTINIHRVSRWLATEQCMRLHPAWLVPDIDGAYLNALALASTAFDALRNNPPSVIVGTGPRFSNFLAARWLANAFGAKLVLHYRDEWTVNTPAFVQNTAHDRMEEALCLARAQLVGFVSEGKEALYRAAFPCVDPRKFLVIPNGWDPYFHDKAARGTHHLPTDAFTVTYTGRWHASLRPLLDTFAKVLGRSDLSKPLLLVIIGTQLPENEQLMAEFAKRYPSSVLALAATAPSVAIEAQRESSVLLLINDHLYDGVVPLKTFDYLCSAQPVLVYGRTGGAAEIVQSLGAGLTVAANDADAFGDAILNLVDGLSIWDTPQRRAWCVRHNRKILFSRMFDAMAALNHIPNTLAPAPKIELNVVAG